MAADNHDLPNPKMENATMEPTTMDTLTNGANAAPAPARHEAAARLSWPRISHALAYPLTLPDGSELKTIVVSEPDLETLERVAEAVEALGLTEDTRIGVKHLRPILAALTGIPGDALKRLHYSDVQALSEAVYPLLTGLMT